MRIENWQRSSNVAKRRPSVEENTQLDELFPEEKRRGKRKRSPSPSQVQYPHTTYRLLPGQHEELKAIAEEVGVSLNELVRWVFADFIKRYRDDKGLPTPANRAKTNRGS